MGVSQKCACGPAAARTRRHTSNVRHAARSPARVVLRVDADGKALGLKARRFEDIEFITYRDDLGGAVACGRQQTLDAVYVTWRGEPTVAGLADAVPVAVEFLPRGFIPPAQPPLSD